MQTMEQLDKIFSYAEKPTQDFDKNLISMEFKKLFEQIDENNFQQLEYNFLLKYSVFLADNLAEQLPEQLQKFEKTILEKMSSETLFRVFRTLLALFQKQVYLGPAFTYIGIDKRLKQEKQEKTQVQKKKSFPFYDFTPVLQKNNIQIDEQHLKILKNSPKMLNLYNYKYVKLDSFINRQENSYLEYMGSDGESWMRLLPFSNIFIVFEHIINFLVNNRLADSQFFSLWAARVAYFHNNIIFTPTGTLKERVLKHFDNFFENVIETKDTEAKQKYAFISKKSKALLYVECSNIMLFFYQYNRSQKLLTQAQNIFGVTYNFTGKVGVRTKYQTFKIAQLVVEVVNNDEKREVDAENEATLNPYEVIQQQAGQQEKIQNHQFDEESILYETPKLEESELKDYKSELNIYDQIIIIGLIKHLDITNPHDDMYTEQVQAYCNILVDKSLNWLVFTNSLLVRSLNEFEKLKRMDRALLQLQTLIDQFNDPNPGFLDRSLYTFPLTFPSQIELYKIVAEKYMKCGMFQTACQLFDQLQMYEECVECLFNVGQREKAKEVAFKNLRQNPKNPRMLCIVGDLTSDVQFYKKAWKVSGKTYPRAQRALGQHYFYTNKLEKSINAFKKATKINCMQLNAFFTMGCAQMKLQRYQEAVASFSSVIQINDQSGDAWANMANAFICLGKKDAAYSTLEQAVRHNEGNFRMWVNLLHVSFQNKKFYKYFECIQRIITLQKGLETIDQQVLGGLNQVMAYQLSQYNTNEYKGPFNTIKNRIERLYVLMGEKIGQNPIVWEYFATFIDMSVAYLQQELQYELQQNEKLKDQKPQQQQEGQENQKIQQQYKNPDDIKKRNHAKQREKLTQVYDLTQNSMNVLMVSGWENSKPICESMAKLVPKLIEAHKNAERGESGNVELKRFLATILPPMEKNLEMKLGFSV